MPRARKNFPVLFATPDSSTLQGKSKKVRVIGSSKQIKMIEHCIWIGLPKQVKTKNIRSLWNMFWNAADFFLYLSPAKNIVRVIEGTIV